jgi:hypothetical protein
MMKRDLEGRIAKHYRRIYKRNDWRTVDNGELSRELQQLAAQGVDLNKYVATLMQALAIQDEEQADNDSFDVD